MAQYWTVAVGINQYRFFPPLSYAQRDAELWHEVLLEAGFSAQRCRLLADQITITNTDFRFPTAQNIRTQLAQVCEAVQAGDLLICFFSGYGLNWQGKDYLLPIDADPRQISTTGIAVESLFETLKTAATKNIVLVLDANHSLLNNQLNSQLNLPTLANQTGFGGQTLQLAEAQNLAVLLSCRPDQFSHEPLTLRQGIFTAALVSALTECFTLEQVAETLGVRLPQLSEEFWRPRQDLQAVVPPHLRHQLLLPEPNPAPQIAQSPSGPTVSQWLHGSLAGSLSGLKGLTQAGSELSQSLSASVLSLLPKRSESDRLPPLDSVAVLPSGLNEAPALSDEFFWRRLLAQGGLIAGILLFGVVLRNSGALVNSPNRIAGGTPSLPPAAAPRPSEGLSGGASGVPAESQTEAAAGAGAVPSPVSPAASPVPLPVVAVDPALVMQSAQAAFESQQYEEANRQLVQIPAAQRSPEQTQLLEQVNRELLNQAKTMLIRTRNPMPENQVSDLVEAIKVARIIKPEQPLYLEAQQNVDRWSRLIMDMAQG
ncbi:MAG: caspase family protein, partial [Elainella sp.]